MCKDKYRMGEPMKKIVCRSNDSVIILNKKGRLILVDLMKLNWDHLFDDGSHFAVDSKNLLKNQSWKKGMNEKERKKESENIYRILPHTFKACLKIDFLQHALNAQSKRIS